MMHLALSDIIELIINFYQLISFISAISRGHIGRKKKEDRKMA